MRCCTQRTPWPMARTHRQRATEPRGTTCTRLSASAAARRTARQREWITRQAKWWLSAAVSRIPAWKLPRRPPRRPQTQPRRLRSQGRDFSQPWSISNGSSTTPCTPPFRVASSTRPAPWCYGRCTRPSHSRRRGRHHRRLLPRQALLPHPMRRCPCPRRSRSFQRSRKRQHRRRRGAVRRPLSSLRVRTTRCFRAHLGSPRRCFPMPLSVLSFEVLTPSLLL